MTQMRRTYQINMPQMAMGGLSETWLFKEMGDIHWALITEGLGTPSSELADANGSRLYATFTRIRFESTVPLAFYRENDRVDISARISQLGGIYFFSKIQIFVGEQRIDAELMSTFTKRAHEGSNTALLKGRPVIPDTCRMPMLSEPPEFASAFRQHRTAHETSDVFSTDYRIQPCHDINGVNLLYFAAYPAIMDLCEMRGERDSIDWSLSHSIRMRDIFYAANCDVKDSIRYKLHSRSHDSSGHETRSTLTRQSDGTLMAYAVTERALF